MHSAPTQYKDEKRKNLRLRAFAAALALTVALTLSAGQALAKNNQDGYSGPGQTGGYTGPGPEFVTVEQAKNMKDDAHVALKGYIVQRLGGDRYLFKDKTGDIILEISERRWAGQQIGAEDLVEVYGEIDKDWFDLEVEVKQLIKP